MYSRSSPSSGVPMPKSFHDTTAPEISASLTRNARSSSDSPSRLERGLIDSSRFPFRRTAAASASFSAVGGEERRDVLAELADLVRGLARAQSGGARVHRLLDDPHHGAISSSVAARSSASSPMT